MGELTLRHPDGVTRVFVGPGALAAAHESLAGWMEGRRLFVVTSVPVRELHGDDLEPLAQAAAEASVLTVPDGEAAKTLGTADSLWREMLRRGGKRDSRVVTFGGGTVGDLGGFVAGCFLRGVEYAQLPTTLLAQVDAAIGGKTAIDLPAAKNSVGLFHHPRFVVADSDWLASLPTAELTAGLAEVVKIAAIRDAELFAAIERDVDALLAGDPTVLVPIVEAAIAAKIAVVEEDAEERSGVRQLLNFGHTLGHALESAVDYEGLRHGEAITHGMRFAVRLAERRRLGAADAGRLRRVLERLPSATLPELSIDTLVASMRRDKKAREGGFVWVLPTAVGEGAVVDDVGWSEVREELARFLAVVGV